MGKAALKSAETGQLMLDWMKDQASITNNWAGEDRARYTGTFLPLQDQFIQKATTYDTPERRAVAADQAAADVSQAAAQALGTRERQAMAMGVNPASGRFQMGTAKASTDTALATAGARNMARRQVEATGDQMLGNAINMGQGLAVNPGTSMGISNGAAQSGFSGAMSGYGQQASILNQDYQNRYAAWQANQAAIGGLGGALGTVVGLISSKKVKTNRKPVDALGAVEKMPVEAWDYKPGVADEGRHIGPYAEDFAKATGIGDGKTIDPISLMGVTMGAVRQLSEKVDKLAATLPRSKPQPMGAM
ncbi:MAG: tail fiber domain-containing protein [Proteobacteria bacterium]|nr:tail fiber domain-containing protein [Pseudomonadota bacterium]